MTGLTYRVLYIQPSMLSEMLGEESLDDSCQNPERWMHGLMEKKK